MLRSHRTTLNIKDTQCLHIEMAKVEKIPSGAVLKPPRVEDMNAHEQMQYRLHTAIEYQDIQAVRQLLSFGVDNINEVYELEVQLWQRCCFVTQTLLVRQIDYEERGYAPRNHNPSPPEITTLLLDAGVDVNLPDMKARVKGITPLIVAIPQFEGLGYYQWNRYESPSPNPWQNMRILLDHGADANMATDDGTTPLEYACGLNCLTSVRILLQHGARVNVANNDGETALSIAAYEQYPEMIKLLFEFGANPNQAGVLTKTVGGICAGDDTCATLFKDERIRIAELEHKEIAAGMTQFSRGTHHRVSGQTHMHGLQDLMGNISLHLGYTSMENRLLAIQKLADEELDDFKNIMVPLIEGDNFQGSTIGGSEAGSSESDDASDPAYSESDAESASGQEP
jgi:ankyrin repeat protein